MQRQINAHTHNHTHNRVDRKMTGWAYEYQEEICSTFKKNLNATQIPTIIFSTHIVLTVNSCPSIQQELNDISVTTMRCNKQRRVIRLISCHGNENENEGHQVRGVNNKQTGRQTGKRVQSSNLVSLRLRLSASSYLSVFIAFPHQYQLLSTFFSVSIQASF